MSTETMDERYADLDLQATTQVLDHLLESQVQATRSVAQCLDELGRAVDAAAARLRVPGSRLILAGAGASGRLAIQDGAELWPTYGWPAARLVLEIAGGPTALLSSMDGIEDDREDAARRLQVTQLQTGDVVVAVAASGRTPWTCCWLEQARDAGALAIGIANNPDTPLLQLADHGLHLASGTEVLAGSTRMAAGTAQKVLLNLFSTALMVRLNRTYGNLMVDMAAVNSKLDDRRLAMLRAVIGDSPEGEKTEDERRFLQQAKGNVKLACLLARGLTLADATALLESVDDSLRSALKKAAMKKQ